MLGKKRFLVFGVQVLLTMVFERKKSSYSFQIPDAFQPKSAAGETIEGHFICVCL